MGRGVPRRMGETHHATTSSPLQPPLGSRSPLPALPPASAERIMSRVNTLLRHAAAIVLLLTGFAFAADPTTKPAPSTAPAARPGEDWPQFLGPTRNGVYPGGDVPAWPAGGPKEAWRVDCGAGWAGPVVVDGKVLLFHRVKD